MATGYKYSGQFYPHKPAFEIGEEHMIPIAEELAAFILCNEAEGYEGNDEALIRLLPQIVEKFPNTITCVQTYLGRHEDRDKPYLYTFLDRTEQRSIYDEVPEYTSSLSWIVAVNDITAYWKSMAYEAELLALIHAASVPDTIRAFLLDRHMKGERIDYRAAKEDFKSSRDGEWYIAVYQHAYTDEHLYAYIADGAVKIRSTSYSIGD